MPINYHSSAQWLLVFGIITLVSVLAGALAGCSQLSLLLQPKDEIEKKHLYIYQISGFQNTEFLWLPGIPFDIGILCDLY